MMRHNCFAAKIEYIIQQIGRSGRDQKTRAYCVLFYGQNGDDDRIVKSLAKKERKKTAETVRKRYQQMREFADSKRCMVQEMLAYQGQTEEKSCKSVPIVPELSGGKRYESYVSLESKV